MNTVTLLDSTVFKRTGFLFSLSVRVYKHCDHYRILYHCPFKCYSIFQKVLLNNKVLYLPISNIKNAALGPTGFTNTVSMSSNAP
jgi:hypothetical protein